MCCISLKKWLSIILVTVFSVSTCPVFGSKDEDALKASEEAINLNPKLAEAWANKGTALVSLGRYEEALKAAEEAINLNPKLAYAWANKGIALVSLGRHEDALKAVEEAINLNPKLGNAWVNKGAALVNLGRYEEALKASEEAINLNPKLAEAWANKSAALASLGRHEDALKAAEEAINLNPKLAYAWVNKGAALVNLGRYEEALKVAEEAINLNPKLAYAWVIKGAALVSLGRYREVQSVYKNAINQKPDDIRIKDEVHLGLGVMLFETGDIKGASENIETITKQDDSRVFSLQGMMEIEKKNYDKASEYFKEAIHLAVGNPEFLLWDSYADYLRIAFKPDIKPEKYQEGIAVIIRKLEKARELSHGNTYKKTKPYILYFLACFYLKSKEVFAAEQILEECLTLKPESKIKILAKALLNNVWNNQIRPSWWRWWLCAPGHLNKIWKRAGFGLLTAAIFVSLPLYPFIRKCLFPSLDVNATLHIIFVLLLIVLLFLPEIKYIKAKDFEIELRTSPPPIDFVLSTSMIEQQMKSISTLKETTIITDYRLAQ